LYTYHSKNGAWALAWSPNGKQIASASDDGTMQVWDPTTGTHVYIYHRHSGFVSHALWSPDSGRIALVGGDDAVRVWIAQ
jgi:WD40 repeat protein